MVLTLDRGGHMQKTRGTFMSYEEVLRESANRCQMASNRLRNSCDDVAAPWRSMIEQIVRAEDGLATSLNRFADEGPAELLATRTQYIPLDQTKPDAPTVGAALKQLIRTNDEIKALVAQQSEKVVATKAMHETTQLSNKIDAVSRKISMIRQSSRDL